MRIKPSIGNCTYFATSHCFKRGQFKMEMINHWTCNYPIFRKKHKKKLHFAWHKEWISEPSPCFPSKSWGRPSRVPS